VGKEETQAGRTRSVVCHGCWLGQIDSRELGRDPSGEAEKRLTRTCSQDEGRDGRSGRMPDTGIVRLAASEMKRGRKECGGGGGVTAVGTILSVASGGGNNECGTRASLWAREGCNRGRDREGRLHRPRRGHR
jgi:hypothetical protein